MKRILALAALLTLPFAAQADEGAGQDDELQHDQLPTME